MASIPCGKPQPVADLVTTQAKRTFYFDPTPCPDRKCSDAQGRLMFAAGTRANPFDIVSPSRRLFFSTPATRARSPRPAA